MSYDRRRIATEAGIRPKGKVLRNRVRPDYQRLFRWFVFILVVSGAVSYALCTPRLRVRQVRVYGVHLGPREAVERAGGRAVGQSIFLVRKSPIVDEISSIPEVRQVKMGRRLPDAVWIRVWERKPAAVVKSGGRSCMIDGRGFVFHVTSGPVRGLPFVCTADSGPMRPGAFASGRGVRAALAALKCAGKEGVSVAKISVDRQHHMCLNMGSDFYVKLGPPEEMARKLSLLSRALKCKPSLVREAAYIDLSCPSAPVYIPKAAAQAAS